MTDPSETANLVGEITEAYRAHIAAAPGQSLGSDIEGQADALADDSARLAELLSAFTQEPRRSLDAIAVFQALSRSAESMATAAAELRRQEVVRPRGRRRTGSRSRMEGRPRRSEVRRRHLQVDR